ncbi:MAG: four helix bundle protein [Acidobacteriota bacterium]
MKTKSFRDLLVWQRSMSVALEIYSLTASFPRSELFGITNQMRRAAVSVASNIAEGHGRLTDKSFAVFLGQARGSLNELATQLDLSFRLGFAERSHSLRLGSEIEEVARMLNALLTTLRYSSSGNSQKQAQSR